MGNQLKAGDVVTYNGWTEEQVKWGNNDTPYMLIVGRQYVVESVEPHKWHTKVSLFIVFRASSTQFTSP